MHKQKTSVLTVCFYFYGKLHEKRSDKNSKTSAMAGFFGAIYDIILSPAGVQLRDDKEHLICS
tara:strand:+ start:68 stop:256 length:189 start_codon:yes stop_codon:yes gene_type:complete